MITAASAALQKLGYSALKAKQMDIVIGIFSERDVFTTLITRTGESLCLIWSPAVHLRQGAFHILYHKFEVSRYRSYSQDTVEIQYPSLYMYNYAHTAHHSYAIIMKFGNSNGTSR